MIDLFDLMILIISPYIIVCVVLVMLDDLKNREKRLLSLLKDEDGK